MPFLDSPVDCAVRGAELLDRMRPEWWRSVPLDQLCMAEPEACILGWTFEDLVEPSHSGAFMNSYWMGLRFLWLDHGELSVEALWALASSHGFLHPENMTEDEYAVWYAELDAAWTVLISERALTAASPEALVPA